MEDSRLLHPVSVGSFTIPGNLFLAPVAGYSDAAFRSIVTELGCDLAFTEMVSSEAMVRDNKKTLPLLARADNEKSYAIQLFGSNPETMARAALAVMAWNPSLIDINCGCPVPKIVRSGAGSALLKNPEQIGAIVRAMKKAVPVPVTVKIRLGWDDASLNFVETAYAAAEAGASAVTLHARTRAQGYSGKADWSRLARLKRVLKVPVFGSGDVFSPAAALDMLRETGCDAVMFARGVMGNPFIFMKTKSLANTGEEAVIGSSELIIAARRHFERSLAFLDKRIACVEFRKQFCAYAKGFEGSASLRSLGVKASSPEEWEQVFQTWERSRA